MLQLLFFHRIFISWQFLRELKSLWFLAFVGGKEDQSTTPSEIWPGRHCPQMTWCRVTLYPAKQALTRQDTQVAQCWLPHHGDEQQDQVGTGT